ncbi:class I SAM-dependent methyltransferase [Ornithinimicrobium cerasi]|uniref:class I SAM-dependent methyltransferase n=1 Tax=Ornithinimicrobium cerasi TaxID=2248773 RepID=UPI00192A371D|nr:class I SAM-dependent methyltransferase [Ornithinimicrobium cerasi]
MVRRTGELAEELGASLRTVRAAWHQLTDHLDDASFDMVFCVGNSLHHAEGVRGRMAALESMSRLDVRDELVRRNGRDALVIYRWEIAPHWEQEHHIELLSRSSTRMGRSSSARNCCPAGPIDTTNSDRSCTASA